MKRLIRPLFFLSIILLTSCPKPIPEPEPILCRPTVVAIPVWEVPASVLPYVESFAFDALLAGKMIPESLIVMLLPDSEWPGDRIGICKNNGGIIPIVELKRGYWLRATEVQKWYLIYHELGHCWLRYGHTETDPHDIMYPSIGPESADLFQVYRMRLFTEKYPRLQQWP